MPEVVNPVGIFVPVLVVVALTFIAFIRMSMMRGNTIKAGHDPNYYRAQIGDPEPEATRAAVRHWNNLFELPTLFYAGSLTAYALGAVTAWSLLFAWVYTVTRLLQSAIHLTYNNPVHRGMIFSFGALFLFALWVQIGLAVFAKL